MEETTHSKIRQPLRWLRRWRKAHSMTQTEAAELFGVHPMTYTKWEQGTMQLQGPALRLAHILQSPQGMRLLRRLDGDITRKNNELNTQNIH